MFNAFDLEQLFNRAVYAGMGLFSLHQFATSTETDYMNILSGATYLANAFTPTTYPKAIKTGHAVCGLHFLYHGMNQSSKTDDMASITPLAMRGFVHLHTLFQKKPNQRFQQPLQLRPAPIARHPLDQLVDTVKQPKP